MHASYAPDPLPLFIPVSGAPQKSVGFNFSPRNYRVNWMKIASLDLERIIKEADFNALQENIMEVTFCNVDLDMEISRLDPLFTKLFKLSQLIIEYLLHSQEYLSETIGRLDEKLRNSGQQFEDMKQGFSREQDTADQLKNEVKKKKKLLQQLLKSSNMVSKCPYCQKVFLNNEYLQKHLIRRHTDIFDSQTKEIFKKFETETNEIKDKLKAAEIQLEAEKLYRTQQPYSYDEPQHVVVQKLDDWRNELVTSFQREIDDVKESFLDQLKMFMQQTGGSPGLIKKKQTHQAHIGFLEDDKLLNDDQNESEEKHIDNSAKQQNSINETLQHHLELQEKRWQLFLKKTRLEQQALLKEWQDALEISINALRNQQNSPQSQRKSPFQDKDHTSPTVKKVYESEPTLTSRPFQTSYIHNYTGVKFPDENEFSDIGLNYDILKRYNKPSPTIFRSFSPELNGILDDKLYSHDISLHAEEINNNIFNNKLEAIKSERDKLAQKNQNMNNTYEMLMQQADALANRVQLLKAGTAPLNNCDSGGTSPFLTGERFANCDNFYPYSSAPFRDQDDIFLSSARKDSTMNYFPNANELYTSFSESSDEQLYQAQPALLKSSSELSHNTNATSVWGSSIFKDMSSSSLVRSHSSSEIGL